MDTKHKTRFRGPKQWRVTWSGPTSSGFPFSIFFEMKFEVYLYMYIMSDTKYYFTFRLVETNFRRRGKRFVLSVFLRARVDQIRLATFPSQKFGPGGERVSGLAFLL